jgi:glyoxylase-like metal-dependent hydrolase (beta-lactamase superfamily II)
MAPRTRDITSEIEQVGGSGLTDPDDAAIYLLRFGEQAVLVDAGCGRAVDRLLMSIEAAGVSPTQIGILLLTHCHYDHTGGAAELRRRFGWQVVLHPLDAVHLEAGDDDVTAASWYGARIENCPVDLRVGDGDVITVGSRPVQVIHIPGHSPGSLAYLVESRGQRVLFAQDVHGPLHPSLLSDRRDYQASLRKLAALEADILCEGHYGIFSGREAVARFLERFIEE